MVGGSGQSRKPLVLKTRSAAETKQLAESLAPILVPGDMIVLAGDLGAGKTTFVQGLARGLGIVEKVTSPTFILMKEYLGGRFPLMHMDIYRLGRVQDVIDLGYDEFLDPSYVVAIEWGDRVEALLPKDHLKVELRHGGGDERTMSFIGKGEAWVNRVQLIGQVAAELNADPPSAKAKTQPGSFAQDFSPGNPRESGRNN
ncbi:MAG: tRNA (adenosine(37)-N6)-threonylcarbamoyltransferase complex ATPase subunit type 1 TsaE [Actinomycetota bacterium]